MQIFTTAVAGLAASLILLTPAADAAGLYSGTVHGLWTDAVLRGSIIDPTTGLGMAVDNSGTAVCNIGPCPGALPTASDTVTWGDGDPAIAIRTSTIRFTGASFAGVPPGSLFPLGTLTFTNGSSFGQTLIFGATLTLSVDVGGGLSRVDPFVTNLGFYTTGNTGTKAQNADFVGTFGGTIDNQVTFNVFEGDTATAVLYGLIRGDPMLIATEIKIAPGSEGSGFIGSGVPPPVPEPGTAALLLSGLALMAGLAGRHSAGR